VNSTSDIFNKGTGLSSDYEVGLSNSLYSLTLHFGPGWFTLASGQPVTVESTVFSGPSEVFYLTGDNVGDTAATQFQGTFAVAAVPEPSTWAMMILGFAGIGFMA
jgi:hypothetical protein